MNPGVEEKNPVGQKITRKQTSTDVDKKTDRIHDIRLPQDERRSKDGF